MKSRIDEGFRELFRQLPEQIQVQARKNYKLFSENPQHPSLQFKRLRTGKNFYSIRISAKYRAIGELENNEITWFWIGSHADYDKLISQF